MTAPAKAHLTETARKDPQLYSTRKAPLEQPSMAEGADGSCQPAVLEPQLSGAASAASRNRTSLPHVQKAGAVVQLSPRTEARYERLSRLGAGGMGEVHLVRDNDIGRSVAVKRLLPRQQTPLSIASFISEVRTVGQLEHPNIVPIHDVGIDEDGLLFFVMKHIDGETLEQILEKLDAGDPSYLAKYTIERRTEIFVLVLRALQCAHAQGIIHCDLKPSNIMIGRFGEVVLMDWGVARLSAQRRAADAPPLDPPGALVGTPMYMSPEQAAGKPETLDERSDIYSACVLFHELLCVRHYLHAKQTIEQVIFAILGDEVTYTKLIFFRHPRHPVPPAELLHFVVRGMEKSPEARWQSVEDCLFELEAIRDGRCRVSCPATLAKRMTGGVGRFVNHYPKLSPFVFYAVLLLLLINLGMVVRLSWLSIGG